MKQILKQTGTLICSVFIVAYTVMQLSLSTSDTVDTEHAFYSVVNDTLVASAYIFRDEMVIMQDEGMHSYSVENGQKVHVGQQLCVTYESNDEADVQKQINEITNKIDMLEKSSIKSGSFSTDLSRLNSSISRYMLDIQRSVAKGDIAAAKRLQDTLLIQMNRRQATVADNDDYFGSRISELSSRKIQLEDSLSGTKITTSASVAGYFYTAADGYERAFSSTELNSITTKEFKKLVDVKPETDILDNAVGKIAVGSKWYIAFIATRRDAAYFNSGNKYSVMFTYAADKEISMNYEGTGGDTKGDEVVLIFSTNTLPNGFNFTRKQEVKVIKTTMQGLKVRTSALVNVDGETGVYTLSSGRVAFKTAEVICESDGFYLVKLPNENNRSERSATKLSLYDTVLIGGKNLYVGKVIS